MEYTLENEKLKVTISSVGAEVVSVIDKATGKELTWNGDARFWGGHAPILFPACGGLWNGEYTLEGKTYKMPKHGVVRRMDWCLHDVDDDVDGGCSWVVLSASSNDETKVAYPFDFELLISYELTGTELTCSYVVRNDDETRTMPFQIGGHPSFALPDYNDNDNEDEDENKNEDKNGHEIIGYLEAVSHQGNEVDAHCLTVVRVGEKGCWRTERYPAPTDDKGLIPISVETFEHEALIFDRNQLGGFCVLDAEKRVLASVQSEAPAFLVWQPKGMLSPFVCVEPWFGLCDQEGQSTGLIERPYSRCAMPGEERWGQLYRISFNE